MIAVYLFGLFVMLGMLATPSHLLDQAVAPGPIDACQTHHGRRKAAAQGHVFCRHQ